MTIKPSIDMLRTLALDYRPEAPYFVCLDRDKRMAITAARQLEADAREHLDTVLQQDPEDAAAAQSMTDPDPVDKAKAELADATAALTAAMDDALPWSVAIIFGTLPTSDEGLREGESYSYEGLRDEMSDDGKIDTDAFADRLLTLCYLRTESPDSEDMDLTWAEASRLLDVSDRKTVRAMIIGHHLVGAAVPFDPRTSGQSATT